MLLLHVDQSWYERTWLTERVPSRAARLSLRARLIVQRLAHVMSAVAALFSLRIQEACDSSPSFR